MTGLTMLGVATAGLVWRHSPTATPAPVPLLDVVQLTANPPDLPVTSARISPDGRYLAYADADGLYVRVIDTGELTRLPDTAGMNVYAWTADGTRVRASACDPITCTGWDLSLIGQPRHRSGAAWPRLDQVEASEDGSRLIRITPTRDLFVDELDGRAPRRLARGVVLSSWGSDQRDVYFSDDFETIKRIPVAGGEVRTVFTTRSASTQIILAGIGPVQRDGRIFLVLQRPSSTGPFETSLWSAIADPGRQEGVRRQLTEWHEAGVMSTASVDNGDTALSASSGGRRVAFLRVVKHEDVYVAAYDRKTGLTESPRRLTLDERDDRPCTWTPDSSAVIYSSVRGNARDLFVQGLNASIPDPLVLGPGDQGAARVTKDLKWLLYVDMQPTSTRMMRRPFAGGLAQPVVTFQKDDMGFVSCSYRGRCVLMVLHANEVIVSEFDPEVGPGRELTRIPPNAAGMVLLPDGNSLAYMLPPDARGVQNHMRIVSFVGEEPRDLVVRGAVGLRWLWSLPAGGFVASDVSASGWSAGATGLATRLLAIDPDGEANEWWRPKGVDVGAAISSPDGTHLAIGVAPVHSDAWMVEGL